MGIVPRIVRGQRIALMGWGMSNPSDPAERIARALEVISGQSGDPSFSPGPDTFGKLVRNVETLSQQVARLTKVVEDISHRMKPEPKP